jgi:hypothetical protein
MLLMLVGISGLRLSVNTVCFTVVNSNSVRYSLAIFTFILNFKLFIMLKKKLQRYLNASRLFGKTFIVRKS